MNMSQRYVNLVQSHLGNEYVVKMWSDGRLGEVPGYNVQVTHKYSTRVYTAIEPWSPSNETSEEAAERVARKILHSFASRWDLDAWLLNPTYPPPWHEDGK